MDNMMGLPSRAGGLVQFVGVCIGADTQRYAASAAARLGSASRLKPWLPRRSRFKRRDQNQLNRPQLYTASRPPPVLAARKALSLSRTPSIKVGVEAVADTA